MNKPRLEYIDIMRAFAIILVVAGHLLNNTGAGNEKLYGIIYSFHMPLFMAISGFVAAYSYNFDTRYASWQEGIADTARYIIKKFRHIMIPYIAWPCLAHPFIFSTYEKAPDYASTFRDMFITNVSLWFLPCLFGLSVCFAVYKLAYALCRRESPWLNLGIVGLISAVVIAAYAATGWDPLRSVASYLLPFFLGIFAGQYPAFYHCLSKNEHLYTIGLLLLMYVAGLYFRDSEALCGKVARIICGCASVPVAFYWFRQHTWQPGIARALTYIGRNTLIIYILHSAWICGWDLSAYHFPMWMKLTLYPALTLLMILPILGVNLILEQSALTRALLLGRK